GKVRWQVTLPPNLMAVSARGDATTEQQWVWRGWQPGLEPAASTSDLEQWLTGQDTSEPGGEASLVSGRRSLEPLRVFRVSRPVWFVVCSGIVLLAGLLLYLMPPSPAGWLVVLGAAVTALGLVGWLWPELLPAILYGALPGLVLVAGLTLTQ